MSTAAYCLISLVIGGLGGVLIGWLWARARASSADDPLCAELRRQIADRDGTLTNLRQEAQTATAACAAANATREAVERSLAELESAAVRDRQALADLQAEHDSLQARFSTVSAKLEASEQRVQELDRDRAKLRSELDETRSQLALAGQTKAELEARLKHLEERLNAERAHIEALNTKFNKDFEAIANKLLLENSSRFGQQSSETLDKLLGPLRENLHDFKSRLENVHKDTVAHSTLLKDQIGRIGAEAANLSKALKGDVKTLGNWGENMLDLILDKSGLQAGLHYRRQSPTRGAEGDSRILDVVIDLPDQKNLVIDSKVSLKFYEEYTNCGEDAVRSRLLQSHVDCLRAHIKNLGGKRYQDALGITCPDFVLMYIPIEAAFLTAVSNDAAIFSDALDRNVVLTTNSTLLATLRTVAHVWRLADQQKHALEIADRGGKLYDKFVGFLEDLRRVSGSLNECQQSMNEAVRKLHAGPGNLVSQVEKLKSLGVKASKSIPADLLEDSAPLAIGNTRKQQGQPKLVELPGIALAETSPGL